MQTEYKDRPDEALEGMLYDASGSAKDNQTLIASLTIPYGRAVAGISGNDKGAKLPDASNADIRGVSVLLHNNVNGQYVEGDALAPYIKCGVWVRVEEAVTPASPVYIRYNGKKQVQTLVADANFVTGNTITGNVVRTADGASITTAISVPFNTDNATTLSDLADAIALASGVNSAADSGGDTVTVTSDQDVDIALEDFAVAGGASQAEFEVTETTVGIPLSDRGKFRASADSSTALQVTSGMRYASTAAAGEMARLVVNLPS